MTSLGATSVISMDDWRNTDKAGYFKISSLTRKQ